MNYEKRLTFEYSHKYFDNVHQPGLLTVTSLPESRQFLNNMRMKLKATPNGFFIFSSNAETVPASASQTLSFALYANDPWFLNFTDISYINPGEQVFYSQLNAVSRTLKLEQYYPLLPKGLLVNSDPFTVTPNPENNHASEAIESEEGGCDNSLFASEDLYYLDLSGYPDGLYEVKGGIGEDANGGSFNGKKVFVNRELLSKPPLAIFSCEFSGASITPSEIKLQLNSRAVIWQYQISAMQPVSDFYVDSQHAQFSGDPEGPEEFPGFEFTGDAFVSHKAVELTQAPWLGILLKDKSSGLMKTLVNNLPNPEVSKVYCNNGEYFYSVIEVKV